MGTLFEINDTTGVANFKEKGTLNFVLEQGTTTPVSGVTGHLFYRTDTQQPLINNGTAYVAVLGGSFRVYNETPSGTINGVNAVFTTANPYVATTTIVTRDGLIMKPGGVDYTETTPSSGTITFTTAPATSSTILISYSRVEGSSLPLMNKFNVVVGTPSSTYTGSTTVFDLPFAYTIGAGGLLVWASGVLMLVGATNDYQETTNARITFNSARTVGEVVQFIKIGSANDQSTSGWVAGGSYVTLTTSTNQVQIGNGSAGAPALSFTSDTDLGLWRSAEDVLDISTGGSTKWQFDGSGNLIHVNGVGGQLRGQDGTASSPEFAFHNNANTGMYSVAANILGFSTNGSLALQINASQQAIITSGTANAQTYVPLTLTGGHSTQFESQRTTGVSTSSVQIWSMQSHVGLVVVNGNDGAGNIFQDLVFTERTAGTTPLVIASMSTAGSPAARTYSNVSGFELRAAMASGTYTFQVIAFAMNTTS